MYTKLIAFAALAISCVNAATFDLRDSLPDRVFKAEANVTGNGINGKLTFTPADKKGLEVQVDVEGLKEKGDYAFHIHVNPLTKSDDHDCAATGGHLNPFHIDSKTKKCDKNDILKTCELGDLSGAFGKLTPDSSGKATMKFTDPAISFGASDTTILGHSVVIHAPNGDRLACGNIIGYAHKDPNGDDDNSELNDDNDNDNGGDSNADESDTTSDTSGASALVVSSILAAIALVFAA